MSALLVPSDVKFIVLHITDSPYGDVATVDRWHKDNGWEGIGYHFLITNCFPTKYRWETKRPDVTFDGVLHAGRDITHRGAHVRGKNWQSVGVAMVGKNGSFTSKQIETAINTCKDLLQDFPTATTVYGHFELDDHKTCPDLDMDLFREWVFGS